MRGRADPVPVPPERQALCLGFNAPLAAPPVRRDRVMVPPGRGRWVCGVRRSPSPAEDGWPETAGTAENPEAAGAVPDGRRQSLAGKSIFSS